MQQIFGPECQDPIYIPIDENLKKVFLDTHNQLRNHQALGEKDNILMPSIADMATIVSQVVVLKVTGCTFI